MRQNGGCFLKIGTGTDYNMIENKQFFIFIFMNVQLIVDVDSDIEFQILSNTIPLCVRMYTSIWTQAIDVSVTSSFYTNIYKQINSDLRQIVDNLPLVLFKFAMDNSVLLRLVKKNSIVQLHLS